ncbi:hypothetical protein [Streptomyces sp. NPDC057582]|uniref:hypothetical protein n=1 Tax=Streptomyces sp. NPDC057582 TaxID=3346174 RepID=UPI0036A38503
MRATEADIEAALLYRPGGLDSLQQLRDRGVLSPLYPARLTHRYESSYAASYRCALSAPAIAPAGAGRPFRERGR